VVFKYRRKIDQKKIVAEKEEEEERQRKLESGMSATA
jgi:hypothetical protein